jgi:DNA replication protein DnaC
MSTMPQVFEELKMSGALSCYQTFSQSIKDREQLVMRLLEAEVQYRRERALKRRLSQAKFPIEKEWVELDRSLNPSIDFDGIERLFDGEFVEQRRNVCFIGTQGTGKTHSLISLGRELCRKGYPVRFYTACELVNVLEEAKRDVMLTKVMHALLKPKLLIIDELGFVPFSDNGARLLFDVFASRYERGSTAVSTNLSLDKWVEVFGSVELTAALIDRFCHRAELFAFAGDSVRLFHTQKSAKAATKTRS